jgi:N-glycosylase/DNA lyase
MSQSPAEQVANEAIFLAVTQPFDLHATLDSGQVFRWRWEGDWAWGAIAGRAFALCAVDGGLRVISPASVDETQEMLRNYLRLDDDLDALYNDAAADPVLAEAMARYRGLRLIRQDPWECLVSFVCSSVSNIPRISRNLRAVAETYGEPVTLEGRLLHRFPDASALAAGGKQGLYALGLGFRARYIAQIAIIAIKGGLDLAALRLASYDEAKAVLTALPGVGEKVADCVLAFSLDKMEAFPVDRWVRRALVEWYGLEEKAPYEELRAWAQARWGESTAYVQQYLFHYRRLMG